MASEIMREMLRTADPALLEIAYDTSDASDVDGAVDTGGPGHGHHHTLGEAAAVVSLLSMGHQAIGFVRRKAAAYRAGAAGDAAAGPAVGTAPVPSPEALPQPGGDAVSGEPRAGRTVPGERSGMSYDEMLTFARHCLVVHYGKSIKGELVFEDDEFDAPEMNWVFTFHVTDKGGFGGKCYRVLIHENAHTVMPVNWTCTPIL
ncbi:hypothetical protein SSPNP10_04160 [Streptomyces sp. NP10]|uniref:hypothetical protein n=1 Tax=Streptomyces sp. NP10 TaxID=1141731 RepID=UPI000F88EB62|nr:hypothetical protein [Streptomyces sp. NP10]RUP69858.1 hypothetical protein SSPNP10_04160 [Streptomyces sp. NP10]